MDFMTEFVPFMALAVILYAIRETRKVDNAYIPIIAVILGIAYAAWEQGEFTPLAFVNGCQYALLSIGAVATIKYFIESKNSTP